MTTREIHNTVRRMLGHVNSSFGREWENEEIDDAFNKMMDQFVASRAAHYAKGEMQSLEDIVSLIVYGYASKGEHRQNGIVFCPFASNHGQFLDAIVIGHYTCDGKFLSTQNVPYTIYKIGLVESQKQEPDYYVSISLSMILPSGTKITNLKTSPRQLKRDNLNIYQHLRAEAKNQNIYTTEEAIYSENVEIQLSIDGQNLQRVVSELERKEVPNGEDRLNRTIVAPTQIADRLASAYYGPNKNHVLITPAEAGDGYRSGMIVFSAPGCTVSHIVYTYIKKPTPISLPLNLQTNLSDNGKVHQLLCTMTVTELLGDSKDDRYLVKLREQIRAFDNRPA